MPDPAWNIRGSLGRFLRGELMTMTRKVKDHNQIKNG